MKTKISIRLKAAFLLIVFSMNTIIGFACFIGIDIGFNNHHHDETEALLHGTFHHHDYPEADGHHHKSKGGKDNCCNEKVSQFSQLDKLVPHSLNSVITPKLFISLVFSYHQVDQLYTSVITNNIKYFVRSYHPPIPNIRVAIQSFQI